MAATNIDKDDDLKECVDCALPVATHEMCANIAWMCMMPTFFLIQFFKDKCYVFVEERFLAIAADSRDVICNRFKIPDRVIDVMPMDKNGTEYFDEGEGCTKFNETQWGNIVKYNPNNDGIDPEHILQAKADEPYVPTEVPMYYMWRMTTKYGGKLRELLPILNEGHRMFTKKSYPDFKKIRGVGRPDTPDDKYWFEMDGFSCEDIRDHSKKQAEFKKEKKTPKRPRAESQESVVPEVPTWQGEEQA